jgi:hopanoid C-3 methylase
MKVLLVQPRKADTLSTGVVCVEPLGLETIASPLLPEHDVRIVDLIADENALSATLASFGPEIGGVSCMFTIDVYKALELATKLKNSKTHPFVVVGGHHPTLNPQDFNHPCVDAICIGDGERTMPDLVECIKTGGDLMNVPGLMLNRDGKQVFTGVRPQIENLDEVPSPARHLTKAFRKHYYIGLEKPVTTVQTSRGCPFKCNFCSVWKFYDAKCRTMSPEAVVREIQRVEEDYVFFTDDNFLLNVKRAEEIASTLLKNGIKKRYFMQVRSDAIVRNPEVAKVWAKAGLTMVFIGFEKIDQAELESLNKKNEIENNEKALDILQRLGVFVTGSFIVDPGYDLPDFERLRQYLHKRRVDNPSFSILTPLPGTDLWGDIKEKVTTSNYELYDLYHAIVPTKLDLRTFYEQFASLYTFCYPRTRIVTGLFDAVRGLVQGKTTFDDVKRIADIGKALKDANHYISGHLTTPHLSTPDETCPKAVRP